MTKEVKKKITPAQWAEIEVKWKSGEYTLSMLEEEYGMRPESFSRYFKRNGIVKGSDSVGDMIRESLKSDAERRALARAKLSEARRTDFDKMSAFLAQVAFAEITSAKAGGKPLASIEDNLKSLQRASAVLGKCFDVSSRALGLEREEVNSDEIPNLVFGELTPAQVAELKKLDEDSQKTAEEIEELERTLGAHGDDADASDAED